MNGVKPSGDILSPVLSFLGWQFDDTGNVLISPDDLTEYSSANSQDN